MEVVPVYESMMIIFTITAGLCIFDESSNYTWLELAGIFGSTGLILFGIVILIFKGSHIKEEEPEPHLLLPNVNVTAESDLRLSLTLKKEQLLLTVEEALNKK